MNFRHNFSNFLHNVADTINPAPAPLYLPDYATGEMQMILDPKKQQSYRTLLRYHQKYLPDYVVALRLNDETGEYEPCGVPKQALGHQGVTGSGFSIKNERLYQKEQKRTPTV